MNEVEALIEKNKVKINGAPFLKSGTNMKFYESLFTILLGFLITLSPLRFGPIVNISLLVGIIGAAFYLSVKLFLEQKHFLTQLLQGFQHLLFTSEILLPTT